jgi:hypothetical protein
MIERGRRRGSKAWIILGGTEERIILNLDSGIDFGFD